MLLVSLGVLLFCSSMCAYLRKYCGSAVHAVCVCVCVCFERIIYTSGVEPRGMYTHHEATIYFEKERLA
jgi:hypothetical protein